MPIFNQENTSYLQLFADHKTVATQYLPAGWSKCVCGSNVPNHSQKHYVCTVCLQILYSSSISKVKISVSLVFITQHLFTDNYLETH